LVDDDYLVRALGRVAELAPDVLAITGDFMSCDGTEQVDHVARVLGHLRPARLATLAVLGNHDYGCRWGDTTVADALVPRLTDLGVCVLRNEARDVSGLQVAGIDDFWSPCFAPERVLPTLDPARAALVLCHNPDAADEPVWEGYRGWILSGHTHGGQCKPPFLSPPILPVKNRRYTRGAFDLGDGRRLYINSGLGYVRRVRFGVRPEITVSTLRGQMA
jgi:predicted MPP superfamily phosphohydrolase